MKSLAFSVVFSTPKIHNHNTSHLPLKKLDSKDDYEPSTSRDQLSNLKIPGPLTDTLLPSIESPNLLGRREVISIGLIASVLLQSEFADASCEFTTSPSGLAFCDQIVGTGPPAEKGQLIKAHYIGKLDNGKVFDSSYNRGKPLTFRVGAGEVIKGWDQGILGSDGVPPMLAGGKRTLMIPPDLGYGVRGAGCRGGTCIIPPNSVLYFDVEFVGKL